MQWRWRWRWRWRWHRRCRVESRLFAVESRAHWRETASMRSAGAMALQRRQVSRRAVALVGRETVIGVPRMQLFAHPVARHFRQDRCRRDRAHQGVAANDGRYRTTQRRHAITVDHHTVRQQPQSFDGAAHRQHRCLQDVEHVDLFDAGTGHAATQGPCANQLVQRLAPPRREQLGVGQATDRLQLVEDHCRGHHRPGQWAAPGFVDTGDQARTLPADAKLAKFVGFRRWHRWHSARCRAAVGGEDR